MNTRQAYGASSYDEEALAIGRIVVVWRPFETMITGICLVLHRWGNGKEFEKKGPPRSFARKLKMMEECLDSDPRLSEFAVAAKAMTIVARALAEERDFLLHHMMVQPFDDLPSVRINLDRVPWPSAPEYPVVRSLNEPDLTTLLGYILDAVPVAVGLLEAVLSILADQSDQAPGKHGG